MTSDQIIARLGGTVAVARIFGIFPQAVSQWQGLDPETGVQRVIPKARYMYLKLAYPDAFEERRKTRGQAKQEA